MRSWVRRGSSDHQHLYTQKHAQTYTRQGGIHKYQNRICTRQCLHQMALSTSTKCTIVINVPNLFMTLSRFTFSCRGRVLKKQSRMRTWSISQFETRVRVYLTKTPRPKLQIRMSVDSSSGTGSTKPHALDPKRSTRIQAPHQIPHMKQKQRKRRQQEW